MTALLAYLALGGIGQALVHHLTKAEVNSDLDGWSWLRYARRNLPKTSLPSARHEDIGRPDAERMM